MRVLSPLACKPLPWTPTRILGRADEEEEWWEGRMSLGSKVRARSKILQHLEVATQEKVALRLVSRTFTYLKSKTEANAATGAFGLKAKHMRLLRRQHLSDVCG